MGTNKCSFLLSASLLAVISASSMPLKFVTSPDRPTTFYHDIIEAPRREPSKSLPTSITVTSRPYHMLETPDDNQSGESTDIGAWRRWQSKVKVSSGELLSEDCDRPPCTDSTPVKNMTQQEVLEKLFGDYHKHLQQQKMTSGNSEEEGRYKPPPYRPKPSSSSWPIDKNDEDEESPSSAMKYLHHGGYGQQHQGSVSNPPRDGWVTMEPIPWSASKISKWTPHRDTSSAAPPSSLWGSGGGYPSQKPSWPGAVVRPSSWSDSKPSTSSWTDPKPQATHWSDSKPPHSSPWADSKPSSSQWPDSKPPSSSAWYNSKPQASNPWADSKPSSNVEYHHLGIITDGKPPEWPRDPPSSSKPQYKPEVPSRPTWYRPQSWSSNGRPPVTEVVYHGGEKEKESSLEDGHWVLLSSTRGYTLPPGTGSGRGPGSKRAFQFAPSSISATSNRGIRLTVLPSLVNGTTSHGGLLEVEKSFESVEASAMRAQMNESSANVSSVGKGNSTVINIIPQASTSGLSGRSKATLAAIGAGMLPATMAVLMPMFLGKRRRKRDDHENDKLIEDFIKKNLNQSSFDVR